MISSVGRLKPGRVKGRSVIPLTRQPDGMQAWKIIIPTSKVLGNRDCILGPGEVAEFDTQVPHWFGSTGAEPAEILSIFTRLGEHVTVRT